MTGKFITLEGADKAGKSTQAKRLAAWLRSEYGLTVLETREPGGTALGEDLRKLVLGTPKTDTLSETLLMFAARREHIKQRIQPALERGDWVICDRFTDSTRAYQGGGRGVAPEIIETLARYVEEAITPDLTLYLDSPPDGSSTPLLTKETFESENTAFFTRVRATYQALAKKEKYRFVAVAGNLKNPKTGKRLSIEAMEASIQKIVIKRLAPRQPYNQ